jgi:hypothetical protein
MENPTISPPPPPPNFLVVCRHALMTIYVVIFMGCFFAIGVCLYYLSALALDSFQTSAVFSAILVTSSVLLVSSVWGCHRTKDVRSHRNQANNRIFLIVFALFLGALITFDVLTRQNYELLREIESEPLGYWDLHRGEESDLLYNFALEFDDMWEAGGCSGNNCTDPQCSGNPVNTTPLVCDDEGMQAQFQSFIDSYDGTADELRDCVDLVTSIMETETSIETFPVVTWCEARSSIIESARKSNLAMFCIVMVQSIMVFFSIPLMFVYVERWRKERPIHSNQPFLYTSMTDSRWLRSVRSDDELKRGAKKSQITADIP